MGLTSPVPFIATGYTGTPVRSATRARPVLPRYRRPSAERVPSGYMPSKSPRSSTAMPASRASWAASPDLRSMGTWPVLAKKNFWIRPTRPGDVKYSFFARKVIWRGTTRGK